MKVVFGLMTFANLDFFSYFRQIIIQPSNLIIMEFPSVFEPATNVTLIERINKLTSETKPEWGKMNVAQMLAHVNVGYDIAYGKTPVSYNFLMKFMLKTFVKNTVVGSKPYSKNGSTSPVFVIKDERDFEKEKAQLIEYIKKTEEKGSNYFEGRESAAFGKLSSKQWSIQFYKHLDHHLTQFGV